MIYFGFLLPATSYQLIPMNSPFSIHFFSRDFSSPVFIGARITPKKLSWSAFGGPKRAAFRLDGDLDHLLDLSGLLRCPVSVDDAQGSHVWWGYVDRVTLFMEGSKFVVSLDQLYNRVKVTYSFISPDNKQADQLETDYANSYASQSEYGIREIIMHKTDLDETFAENLRDTFLELHAWPASHLSSRSNPGDVYAEITCSGWFSTLEWQSYQNLEGFYANYGPGPGTINFGRPNWNNPSQKFTPGVDCSVKYLYFLLRKNNSPSGSLYGRIYSSSGGSPNSILAVSTAVSAASLPSTGYSWIRFSFSTAYSLSAATSYWASVYSPSSHSTNNFMTRIDENACFFQDNHYAKYSDIGVWKTIPNVTSPGTYPHLYFRVVCITDTGSQLLSIAQSGSQFFADVTAPASNVETSPYLSGQKTCLDEIVSLMHLGTSNNRMILAKVTPDLILKFYEQPDPKIPTAYMDHHGRFYSRENKLLASYFPPVGQWTYLIGTDRYVMPFDQARAPTCFIQHATYTHATGRTRIKTELGG